MKCPGCSGNPSHGCDYPDCQPDPATDSWVESFPLLECPCCGAGIDIRSWLREAAGVECPSVQQRRPPKATDAWVYSNSWETMQ